MVGMGIHHVKGLLLYVLRHPRGFLVDLLLMSGMSQKGVVVGVLHESRLSWHTLAEVEEASSQWWFLYWTLVRVGLLFYWGCKRSGLVFSLIPSWLVGFNRFTFDVFK